MRSVAFTAHNNITLLCRGAAFFPALLAAIEAAEAEIYLETYIFAADATGDQIKDALKRAAGRGVAVYVITDWHGTGRMQSNLLSREFSVAGVHHRRFNPWFRRGVARSHRKICVVDGQVAFIGGLNINDDHFTDDDAHLPLPMPRWDFAVEVTGPLVYTIHLEAEAQWLRLGKIKLKTRLELFRRVRSTLTTTAGDAVLAGLVIRDNLRNRRTIQSTYLRALGRARKSALLANPYFAPGRKFRDALAAAAARGVEVTLLIGVGQFHIQDAVAHAFYPKLLSSGVKVVEYRATQLHAKIAVVDDDWATVGSSNCDGLSLFVNQEANIVVKDAGFSQALRTHIERAVAEGIAIHPEHFADIPWYKRAWYGAAYLFYMAIMRIITLGRYAE